MCVMGTSIAAAAETPNSSQAYVYFFNSYAPLFQNPTAVNVPSGEETRDLGEELVVFLVLGGVLV